jgi:glycine cleavage system H protein
MSESDFRGDRRYTRDHEWARNDGGEVVVGVSSFAVEQLGDITLVSVDAKVGDTLAAGKAFGTVESVKTLSDLFAPVSGTVTRVNAELVDKPELVNEDCWDKGWMIALRPSSPAELEALLDLDAYRAHVKASAH